LLVILEHSGKKKEDEREKHTSFFLSRDILVIVCMAKSQRICNKSAFKLNVMEMLERPEV